MKLRGKSETLVGWEKSSLVGINRVPSMIHKSALIKSTQQGAFIPYASARLFDDTEKARDWGIARGRKQIRLALWPASRAIDADMAENRKGEVIIVVPVPSMPCHVNWGR